MKRILVVEDEEHLAIGIKYNLEAEGYDVEVVSDGPAALAHVADNAGEVDLVVLDLMLPGMSGYDVCERLRATDYGMPILILSARTLTEDRTRAFDVGADQYMMKPFDLDELLSRIKNLIGRHREAASPQSAATATFEFGNAVINWDTYQATIGEDPVRLTRRELTLLRYFVEHENRVVSRDELLANVWGLTGRLNTRAVDQFIRRLRKYFEPDPAKPCHFLTVRDAGYRFIANPEADAE